MHIVAPALGTVAVAIVLAPPLATIAEELFFAHMVQHLLLILVAAPLLTFSGVLAPVWKLRFTGPFTQPATAWLVFVSCFLFWHWPAAFQWAAKSEPTRLLEFASLLFAALPFWKVALSPTGPNNLGYGARALYVMAAAVATDLPGVIMVFSPQMICMMPHENAPHYGLTPLQDQELAGLTMWVPANLVFFAISTWLFVLWMRDPKVHTENSVQTIW